MKAPSVVVPIDSVLSTIVIKETAGHNQGHELVRDDLLLAKKASYEQKWSYGSSRLIIKQTLGVAGAQILPRVGELLQLSAAE